MVGALQLKVDGTIEEICIVDWQECHILPYLHCDAGEQIILPLYDLTYYILWVHKVGVSNGRLVANARLPGVAGPIVVTCVKESLHTHKLRTLPVKKIDWSKISTLASCYSASPEV